MSLPASWVDEFFKRLTVRYGAAFMGQYRDLDADAVKADWAQVLDGFTPDSISYALKNLPADKAPNAMQFRALANAKPVGEVRYRLEAPKADPGRVAALLARMRQSLANRGSRDVAAKLREIAATRPLTVAQKQALAECERIEPSTIVAGEFKPIDPAVLPPAMRADLERGLL